MGNTSSKIKKIAILTDESSLRGWFANGLKLLTVKSSITIPIIVVLKKNKNTFKKNNFKLRRFIERIIFPLFVVNLQKLLGLFPPLAQKVPLGKCNFLDNTKIIHCSPLRIGDNSIDLTPEVIKILIDENISVLINRSNLILRGNVLNCLPYGVWGFHLGNSRSHRGARYLLRSYCEGETEITVTLQKLNDHIDGGDIVLEKSFTVDGCKSYKMFKNYVYGQMSEMLLNGIKKVSSGGKIYPPAKFSKLYKLPNVGTYILDFYTLSKKELINFKKYFFVGITFWLFFGFEPILDELFI